jgi:NAD(P)H-dependent FMN reductase
MHIVAISGSLRVESVNSTILRAMEAMLPAGSFFTYFNAFGTLPHFNPDDDKAGMTADPAVENWRNTLKGADAVMICTPEYALGVPGSLKNALDWIVSTGEFLDKPVAVISASPMDTGGKYANDALRMTLNMMGAKLVADASLTIPFIKTKVDASGDITDGELIASLKKTLTQVINAVV